MLPWKDENDNEKIAPVPGPRSQGRVVENPGKDQQSTSIISEDGKTLVCDTRDRAITWEFCRDFHLTLVFSGLLRKICLKQGEVWRKVFLNKVIVTLVTQGLPSAFLSRPVAY